jgi:hypothetical protein
LTHYVIERQDADAPKAAWQEVGETIAGKTTFKMEGLEEKKKYRFR